MSVFKTKSITGDNFLFLTPLLWFQNRGEEKKLKRKKWWNIESTMKIVWGFLETMDRGGTQLISTENRKGTQFLAMPSEILDREQDGTHKFCDCVATSKVKRNSYFKEKVWIQRENMGWRHLEILVSGCLMSKRQRQEPSKSQGGSQHTREQQGSHHTEECVVLPFVYLHSEQNNSEIEPPNKNSGGNLD